MRALTIVLALCGFNAEQCLLLLAAARSGWHLGALHLRPLI